MKMKPIQINKKAIVVTLTVIFVLLSAIIFLYIGKPLIQFLEEPERFREWVNSHGIWSYFAFIGIVVLQVIVAVIPGEPFEIAAGYAFGIAEGTILCIIGMTLGSIIVFLFVRRFGVKAVEVFFSLEKINSLNFLKNTKKLTVFTYLVFLIPGTPKDLIGYFIGLTNMKLTTWILISSVARIPSIITSTIGGNALGIKNYFFAIIVFAIALFISAVGLVIYNRITKEKSEKNENKEC